MKYSKLHNMALMESADDDNVSNFVSHFDQIYFFVTLHDLLIMRILLVVFDNILCYNLHLIGN